MRRRGGRARRSGAGDRDDRPAKRPREVFDSLTITGGAGSVLWGYRAAVELTAWRIVRVKAEGGEWILSRRSRGSISFRRDKRRSCSRRRGRAASGRGRLRRSRSGRRVYGHTWDRRSGKGGEHMGRCRVASSDVIRLPLSDGDFLTVKKELNAGEGLDLEAEPVPRTRAP